MRLFSEWRIIRGKVMTRESAVALLKLATAKLVSTFGPLFQQGAVGVARWVLQDGPKLLRMMIVIFLLLATILSALLWQRLSEAGSVLLTALSERQENTSQPFKGLEALILSGISADIEDALPNHEVAASVKTTLAEIQKSRDSLQAAEGKDAAELPKGLRYEAVTERSGYFTDVHPGFLFVPSVLLPSNSVAQTDDSLRSNSDLARDITFSQSIATQICALLGGALFESKSSTFDAQPVQSYFVARSGVARLCERGVKSQHEYYGGQFLPTTLFQDRPYFEPTLAKRISDSDSASAYFYATKVYIDLGGNGFVKTFCRTVSSSRPEAIVCVDLRLRDETEEKIRQRLAVFGSRPVRVSCDTDGCALDEVLPWWDQVTGVMTDADYRLLQSRVRHHSPPGPPLSDMFGKISVHQGERGGDGNERIVPYEGLIFTIPLSSRSTEKRTASLLYARIDLARFQRDVAILAAAAGGSALITIALVIALMADYGLRMKEQHRAFKSVAGVMAKAPLAYCHVGESNRFVDYNDQFVLGILNCPTRELGDAFLRGKTFRELLAGRESLEVYERIQEKRATEEETKPYQVKLWRYGNQHTISVEVHGAAVPGPVNRRQRARETFGIILEDQNPAVVGSEFRLVKGKT